MRAGYIPFVISPKNSAIAIAHLLKVTNCSTIFVGGGEAVHALAQEASSSSDRSIELLPLPTFDDLYSASHETNSAEQLPCFPIDCVDKTALIAHSSGDLQTFLKL